jgi:hypothetical protein
MSINVTFVFDKETKNTRKFEEKPEPGTAPAIGTLYVQKHVLHALGNPETLKVSIDA